MGLQVTFYSKQLMALKELGAGRGGLARKKSSSHRSSAAECAAWTASMIRDGPHLHTPHACCPLHCTAGSARRTCHTYLHRGSPAHACMRRMMLAPPPPPQRKPCNRTLTLHDLARNRVRGLFGHHVRRQRERLQAGTMGAAAIGLQEALHCERRLLVHHAAAAAQPVAACRMRCARAAAPVALASSRASWLRGRLLALLASRRRRLEFWPLCRAAASLGRWLALRRARRRRRLCAGRRSGFGEVLGDNRLGLLALLARHVRPCAFLACPRKGLKVGPAPWRRYNY